VHLQDDVTRSAAAANRRESVACAPSRHDSKARLVCRARSWARPRLKYAIPSSRALAWSSALSSLITADLMQPIRFDTTACRVSTAASKRLSCSKAMALFTMKGHTQVRPEEPSSADDSSKIALSRVCTACCREPLPRSAAAAHARTAAFANNFKSAGTRFILMSSRHRSESREAAGGMGSHKERLQANIEASTMSCSTAETSCCSGAFCRRVAAASSAAIIASA
jgi:hypothetical protein